MELWSGGAYKATLHRVVFPTPKDGTIEDLEGRYSIAYFVQPDDEVVGYVDRRSLREEMLTGRGRRYNRS
jgi:isopenicillin N synthase-like dioxygenase